AALMLREIAHLLLRETDVGDVARSDLRQARLDFAFGEPEVLRRPIVIMLRKLPHGGVAALGGVVDAALDRGPPLRVAGGDLLGSDAALQPAVHALSSPNIVASCSGTATGGPSRELPGGCSIARKRFLNRRLCIRVHQRQEEVNQRQAR